MQAEFLGEHDKQGNALPIHGMNISTWEEKNYLSAGSLIANSCKSTLELAGHSLEMQAKGYELGKNIAFAWQVNILLLHIVSVNVISFILLLFSWLNIIENQIIVVFVFK